MAYPELDSFIGRAKRSTFGRKLLADLGLRGLNVGSGRTLYSGWLNTDILTLADDEGRPTARGRLARFGGECWYLEHDATDPFPIDDASLDWVFSEHFLEHLALEAGIAWLREMRRLLRPGGHIRLSTPDLRKYISGYLDPASDFFVEHAKRLEAMGKPSPIRPGWGVNQIFYCWGHRWLYDLDELRFAAEQAGFHAGDVVVCAFRVGRVSEVAGLDHHLRNDESLYVELHRSA